MNDKKKQKLLKLRKEYKNCKRCILSGRRNRIVFGRGGFKKRIAILGEAPGQTEDESGEPFTGKSGREVLDKLLKIAKLDRNDCFIFNSILCFPGRDPEGGFRKPTEEQIIRCAPRLKKTLEILKPKVVVSMGNVALFALTNKEGIAANRELIHEYKGRTFKAEIIVTYHPAAILRNSSYKAVAKGDWKDLGEMIHAFRQKKKKKQKNKRDKHSK